MNKWFRILGRLPIPDSKPFLKVPTMVAMDQLLFASGPSLDSVSGS